MITVPGEAPVESVEELAPLRDAVQNVIDMFQGGPEQFIADALNCELLSLSELGERLGVSKVHAFRLRNSAYAKIRVQLLENPIIRERLGIK